MVIHTNLGRAPLSRGAMLAMQEAAGYVNLEYDLASGERGDRYGHATGALCRLTGAEAAVVVNNCASAVLLALSALSERLPGRREGAPLPIADAGAAVRPEVLVSRGQLVEIGGGFRVPDVLRRSGADLVEVGTTNRTYLADFEGALSPRSRVLLSLVPETTPFRIDCGGLGSILIKRKVFEKMPYPWFDLKVGGYGSDIYFAKHAHDHGIEMWCDPTVECGQIDYYETTVADYKKRVKEEPGFASRGFIIGQGGKGHAAQAR